MGAEKPRGSLGSVSSFLCGLGLILFPGWSSVCSSVKWQFRIRSGRGDSFALCAHSILAVAAQRRVLGSNPAGKGSRMVATLCQGTVMQSGACLISTGPLAQKASDPFDGLSTHCTHEAPWGRHG